MRCKELVPGYSYKFPGEGGNVSIFEGKHIFNDYIDAFYRIKAEASKDSPQRWMAKMHLNSLYGIFGRSCEMNETSIIRKDDIQKVFLTFCVKSMIDITKDYYLITYKTNVNPEIVKDLKVEFKNLSLDDGFESKKVFNNVAIASAVTAYARMHMMQFKVGGKYIPLNVNTSLEEIKSKVVSKKVNYFTKILNKIHKIINKPHRVCVIYKKVSKIKGRNLTFFELVETVDYGLKIWDP